MRIVTIGMAMALTVGLAAMPAGARARTQAAAKPPAAAPAAVDDDPSAEELDIEDEDAAPVPEKAVVATAVAPAGALLFHWPVSEARPDRRGLTMSARWQVVWHGRELRLHWRVGEAGPWKVAVFVPRRDMLDAKIPAGDVTPPSVAYWIESVEADGGLRARFGSAELPQVIRVAEDARAQRLRDRLADHGGHRHRFEASFRHVDFGRRVPGDARSVDNYNQLEIAYTFRALLAGLYQAQIGFLAVGDRLGVQTLDPPPEGRPGAYLAFMKLYWEFGDVFGLEPMLMLGASRLGLAPGGGMTFRFGSIRSTHFDIGIKGAKSLGWSFVTELDVKAASFVKIRVRNELTNWPTDPEVDSDDLRGVAPYGILPSLGLAFTIPGGVEISGSMGYGIRKGYDRGWINWSVGAAVEF